VDTRKFAKKLEQH